MYFHFFGTSAGSPTIDRNVTAMALFPEQRKNWYLFDCGEGTQQRLLRSKITLPRLSHIFITHMHGDHIYGLPGLLASRGLTGGNEPLTIYGPKGIKVMLETILRCSYIHLHYPFEIIEFEHKSQTIFESDQEIIRTVPLSHDVPSVAFVLEEKDRPGHLMVEKAKADGIPPGPFYAALKRGETIDLNGVKLNGNDYIAPPQKGRTVIIGGDNEKPELLAEDINKACLMIHESTHTEEVKKGLSFRSRHSTAASVAKAATEGGLENLILTHFSPRFSTRPMNGQRSLSDIEVEARTHFEGELHLARDYDIYQLDRTSKLVLLERRHKRTPL